MIGLKELVGLLASALFLFSSIMAPAGDDVVAVERLGEDGLEAIAQAPVPIEVDGLTLYEPVTSEGSSMAPVTLDGKVDRVTGVASTLERPAMITFGGERLEVPPGAVVTLKHITGTVTLDEAPLGSDVSVHGTATDVSIQPPNAPLVTTNDADADPLPVDSVSLDDRILTRGYEGGGSFDEVKIGLASDVDRVARLSVGANLFPLEAGTTLTLTDYVGFVALVGADAPHDRLHLEGYGSVSIGDEKITEDGRVSATVPLPRGPGLTDAPEASFSYDPLDPASGEEIDFQDESTHEIAIRSWHWDFDDGSTAEVRNPTHAFDAPGSYDVELSVVDVEGQKDTHTETITIQNTPPELSISWSPLTPEETETVAFTAGLTDREGDVESIEWTFPDGTQLAGETVEHAFPALGDHDVTVVATDEDGLRSEAKETVHVENKPPNASFEITPETPVAGETATLTSTTETFGTGDVVEHEWEIDGVTDPLTGESVDVAFPDFGLVSVTLTVTDEHGDQGTHERMILVDPPPPDVKVQMDPPFPNPGEEVTFTATVESVTRAKTATWVLPDGDTEEGLSFDHVFETPGDHLLEVNVTDDVGSTVTVTREITVNHPPEGALSVPGEGTVEETARETGDPLTVDADVWDPEGNQTTADWKVRNADTGVVLDLEDTDACEATEDPLTVTCAWDAQGIVDLMLEITDDNGARVTLELKVLVLAEPPSILGITPDTVEAGVEVELEVLLDDPDNATTKIEWFKDTLIGTGKTILHLFEEPGDTDLNIHVTYDDGTTERNITGSMPITVNEAPEVDITVSPGTTVETGESVTFDADATDPDGPDAGLTYNWTFGDGNQAGNQSTVTHAYPDDGSFTTTVTVTDVNGASTTETVSMTVNVPPLNAQLHASPQAPSVGQQVEFTMTYDGTRTVDHVDWDIDGDQETTTDPSITVTFDEPKHVDVSATLETEDGATDQDFLSLRVTAASEHEIILEPELPDGQCPVDEPTFHFNFTNQFTGYSIRLAGGDDQWDIGGCTFEATLPASTWSVGDGYQIQGVCGGQPTIETGDFSLDGLLEDTFVLANAPVSLADVHITDRENPPLVLDGANDTTTYHDPFEAVFATGQASWCQETPMLNWQLDLSATYHGPRDALGSLALEYFEWTATTDEDGFFHTEVPAPLIDLSPGDIQVTEPGGSTSIAYLPGQYSVSVLASTSNSASQERVSFIEDPEGIFKALEDAGLVI